MLAFPAFGPKECGEMGKIPGHDSEGQIAVQEDQLYLEQRFAADPAEEQPRIFCRASPDSLRVQEAIRHLQFSRPWAAPKTTASTAASPTAAAVGVQGAPIAGVEAATSRAVKSQADTTAGAQKDSIIVLDSGSDSDSELRVVGISARGSVGGSAAEGSTSASGRSSGLPLLLDVIEDRGTKPKVRFLATCVMTQGFTSHGLFLQGRIGAQSHKSNPDCRRI